MYLQSTVTRLLVPLHEASSTLAKQCIAAVLLLACWIWLLATMSPALAAACALEDTLVNRTAMNHACCCAAVLLCCYCRCMQQMMLCLRTSLLASVSCAAACCHPCSCSWPGLRSRHTRGCNSGGQQQGHEMACMHRPACNIRQPTAVFATADAHRKCVCAFSADASAAPCSTHMDMRAPQSKWVLHCFCHIQQHITVVTLVCLSVHACVPSVASWLPGFSIVGVW
jgi:hypothetical protein